MSLATLLWLASCIPMQEAGEQPPAAAEPAAFDHVLLVSVDGLRADVLADTGALPAFARLLQGPHTLNARTDPDFTVTLPNHVGMVTGRRALGELGHGWQRNDDPKPGQTLHDRGYVPSIFDVAHDHGLRTAVLASKSKFSLFDESYDGDRGLPDTTGADDGRDKIDLYLFDKDAGDLTDAALRFLRQGGRSLLFLHYRDPDSAGHGEGWDLDPRSDYREAVAEVDRGLRRVLDGVQSDSALRGRVAVVLTADHGGGKPRKDHQAKDEPLNYTIPLLVWLGDGARPADLYALNPDTRADPGTAPAAAQLPPIRNSDAANLALALLRLPPVPGSTVNAGAELRWREGAARQ